MEKKTTTTTQKWTKEKQERWEAWLSKKLEEADRIAAGLYARQWSSWQREEQDLAEEYDDEEEEEGSYSEE